MNNNLTVSFDIGIGSVGWAVVDPDHAKLIEFGSHVFNEATSAQQARGFRSARRTQRRRKWREKQLLMAFVDFGLVTEDELKQRFIICVIKLWIIRFLLENLYYVFITFVKRVAIFCWKT